MRSRHGDLPTVIKLPVANARLWNKAGSGINKGPPASVRMLKVLANACITGDLLSANMAV